MQLYSKPITWIISTTFKVQKIPTINHCPVICYDETQKIGLVVEGYSLTIRIHGVVLNITAAAIEKHLGF